MRSPFPGMDPYLEMHWQDVHHSLVGHARDALQRQLTGPLRARIGERLVVELWLRLRDERAFDSEADLVAQIGLDVEATRAAERPA